MKAKMICLLLGAWICGQKAFAQWVTGSGFYVKSGTELFIDSLTLKPSVDVAMDNQVLTVSYAAIPGNPYNSINRVYHFDKVFDFQGEIGIFYQNTELNGNAENVLQVTSSATNMSTFVTWTGSTQNITQKHVVRNLNTSIKIVTLAGSETVLPITLISFTANKNDAGVSLQWTSESEHNSSHFGVERSTDGHAWSEIGSVPAIGSSDLQKKYSFVDTNPLPGANLYRLRMVDLDNSYAYSKIRSVDFTQDARFIVFPNPFVSEVELQELDMYKVGKISVLGMNGEVVYENPQWFGKKLSLAGLVPGTYILKVLAADGSVFYRRIIKSK